MDNKIFLSSGMNKDLTNDEMKILRYLVSEHAREVADKHNIDIKAVTSLKILFFDPSDKK